MKILEYLPALKGTSLFGHLDEGEIFAALDHLRARLVTVAKGQPVLLAGAPAAEFGVVLSGRVHVVREDLLGERTLLAEVPQSGLFAEAFPFAGMELLPVSVFAEEDCTLLMLSSRPLLETAPDATALHTRLLANMLVVLAGKTVHLNQRVELLSKRTTREKLWHYLMGQAQRAGSMEFTIPFGRQELANFLCVERSAMSAELGRMRREGLLDFDRAHFVLHRPHGERFFPEEGSQY